MKCTNCQSTDLVSIQSQSYCINCGQLALLPKATAKNKKSLTKIISPAASLNNAPVVSQPKSEEAKSMSGDIIASRRGASQNILNLKQSPSVAQVAAVPRVANNPQGHPWQISLQIGFLTALPCAVAVATGLYLKLDTDIVVFAIGPGVVIAVASAATLAQAAVMYGMSKRQDGRPVPTRQWWRMASQSAPELLQLNIFALLALILCGSMGFMAWQYGAAVLGSLPLLRNISLLLVNVVLIWLACGVVVGRRLAEAAIVINDVPLGLALRLGLGMYRRVGGHLVAAAGQSLIVSGILAALSGVVVVAAIRLSSSVSVMWHPTIYASGVFIILFALIAVSLHIETRLWVAQYRHWAPLCYPDNRIQDLTTPRKPATKPA